MKKEIDHMKGETNISKEQRKQTRRDFIKLAAAGVAAAAVNH